MKSFLKIWAHFRRFFPKAPETGLSAPIPPPPAGGLRYFRFNPLRGRKPGFFSAESAAIFLCNVKLRFLQKTPI
jgi:hypothetical protein